MHHQMREQGYDERPPGQSTDFNNYSFSPSVPIHQSHRATASNVRNPSPEGRSQAPVLRGPRPLPPSHSPVSSASSNRFSYSPGNGGNIDPPHSERSGYHDASTQRNSYYDASTQRNNYYDTPTEQNNYYDNTPNRTDINQNFLRTSPRPFLGDNRTVENTANGLKNVNLGPSDNDYDIDTSLPVLSPKEPQSSYFQSQYSRPQSSQSAYSQSQESRSPTDNIYMESNLQQKQKNPIRRRPVSSIDTKVSSDKFAKSKVYSPESLDYGSGSYNTQEIPRNESQTQQGWRQPYPPPQASPISRQFSPGASSNNSQNFGSSSNMVSPIPSNTSGNSWTPPVPEKESSYTSLPRGALENPRAQSSYRESLQLPSSGSQGLALSRPLNRKNSDSSSKRRPQSYIENKSNPLSQIDSDWRNPKSIKEYSRGEDRAENPYVESSNPEVPSKSSTAVGVPTLRRESDSTVRQWRYHIQKNLKDFYMTTNPDTEHINCPVGPSYYVDVKMRETNSMGQVGFSMSLVDPMKQFCEITITRSFHPNDEEYFEVIVFKKPEVPKQNNSDFGADEDGGDLEREVSTGNSGFSGAPQIAWKSSAVAIRAPSLQDVNSSRLLVKRPRTRQFLLQDDRGSKWIIGNRSEHHSQNYNLEDVEEEEEEDTGNNNAAGKATKKRSTKVYFFVPGPAGPETDKIMAVVQRRKQLHKKIMKDIGALSHLDDRVTDYEYDTIKRRSIFKGSRSDVNSPAMVSSSFGDAPGHHLNRGSGEGIIEDENAAKFGWLTMYPDVKKRQGMWPIVAGLTLAVSYSQRMDVKEKSVAEKFKRLGRKYRESRMQVFYGHRHTQSSLQ